MERVAVVIGYLFLAWTPFFAAKAMLTALAVLWRRLEPRRRRRAVENAGQCLNVGRDEAERVVRSNYRHLALVALETARLARMGPTAASARIDMAYVDMAFREAESAGRGLIVLGGHLGNWEWANLALARFTSVKAVIARGAGDSHLLAALNGLRERCGTEVWEQKGAMRKCLRALRRGECFAAVVDEDVGGRGKIASFFGRAASTFHLPVALAVRCGAPLVVASLLRSDETMRFRAVCGPVRWPNAKAEPQDEVERLLKAMNSDLADIIREYPDQWHWRKDRWKSTQGKTSI